MAGRGPGGVDGEGHLAVAGEAGDALHWEGKMSFMWRLSSLVVHLLCWESHHRYRIVWSRVENQVTLSTSPLCTVNGASDLSGRAKYSELMTACTVGVREERMAASSIEPK